MVKSELNELVILGKNNKETRQTPGGPKRQNIPLPGSRSLLTQGGLQSPKLAPFCPTSRPSARVQPPRKVSLSHTSPFPTPLQLNPLLNPLSQPLLQLVALEALGKSH